MNFDVLTPFLTKLANDQPQLGSDIQSLQHLLSNASPQTVENIADKQQEGKEIDPHLMEGTIKNKNKPLEAEDQLFRQGLKGIALPNPHIPDTFGKVSCFELLRERVKLASAYVRDVDIKTLPADTKKDIQRFTGKTSGFAVQYGMVVNDLLPKVDPHNFAQAEEHTKGFKDKDGFYKKLKEKYILIVNDSIVDGHHFLAKAKALKVPCSLNVLDLTSLRFQK